jgi:phospholipid N-methyltransferase
MEIGEAIKQGILHIINEKEEFPIGEVNDYLISNRIINERIDFREIFSIAEPILRELGLKWYGVYGPKGVIVCKPKHVEEKKEERKAKEEQRKAKTTKEVVDELEKRISKNGMAYIPENIYGSINHYVMHLFSKNLDKLIERHEWKINNAFERLKRIYGKAKEWDGSGSIQEDERIYRDKWDVLAYILYYFYENHPKIKYILLEGLKRGIKLIPEKEVVEILDFGAGPGTVLAGICDFISDAKEAGIYRDTKLNLYFIEENEDFADACEKMLGDVNFAKVKQVDEGIVNNRHQYFDLITFSNVVSELEMSHEERMKCLNKFRARLKSDGYMIIIEPAYKGQINNLQKLYKNMRGYYRSGCKYPPNDFNCSCCYIDVEREKLRTPEKTTREIKEYFEGEKKKKQNKIYLCDF